jgi:hypothetical protein
MARTIAATAPASNMAGNKGSHKKDGQRGIYHFA